MKATTTPPHPEPKICIIGSGMSGLLMGIRLKQSGYHNFVIYEKAANLGGTWRENSYPGLSCDVPSHYYSYSFDLNPNWSHMFSGGAEILDYFRQAAHKYQLLPHIRFNKNISEAQFSHHQWQIECEDGAQSTADILISACGILHTPKLPEIAGLDNFAGPKFHTARWDHKVDLKGKIVGVIGTGSSGIQTISPLSEIADQIVQFQRTAQWVMPITNTAYSKFHQKLLQKLPLLNGFYHHLFRIGFETLSGGAIVHNGWQRKLVNIACRAHLRKIEDPALRALLTPQYEPMCKRLVMSDNYYTAMQKSNVQLETQAIDHIETDAVVLKDGRRVELDVLVLATGFYPGVDTQLPNIIGAHNLSIKHAWRNGVYSYRSLAMPGFPNFFMLLGPYSPIGNFSVISVAESQVNYILQFIKQIRAGNIQAMSPNKEITEVLINKLKTATHNTIWTTGCKSWYLDKNGNPISWPWSGRQFRKEIATLHLEEWVPSAVPEQSHEVLPKTGTEAG